MKHTFGWVRDQPDFRDLMFVDHLYNVVALPANYQLDLSLFPAVYDQGELGSCTANSVAGTLSFTLAKFSSLAGFNPSRLFIYYNERKDMGTVRQDSGATIRESLKAVGTFGAASETEWPYDVKKYQTKPPKQVYTDALKEQVHSYVSVPQSLDAIRTALSQDHPVCIGFSVYSSFESDTVAKTGLVPLPNARKDQLLGGHAVTVCGYDDKTQLFKCRNSWGPDWGDKGYFYMPYAYLMNAKLASDFWIIKAV